MTAPRTSLEPDLLGDGRALLEPHPLLRVPMPAYQGRSLGNLASSLWSVLHPVGALTPPPLPPLESRVDPFDGRRPEGTVVVLLLDGLGWWGLRESSQRDPAGVASSWTRRAKPITSVFPTTTTVALSSLSTGASPGQNGVAGHRAYLPRFGSVVELLRMSPLGVVAPETLVGPEWSPSVVSGVPSLFRRGLAGMAVSRDRFEGTGFTRLVYDGATYIAYATGTDLALSLVELLSRPDPPPLVFAYRDDLDLVQHVRGPSGDLVDLELEQVDRLICFVARHLDPGVARGTKLLVTGDHGQVPIDAEHQLVVDQEPSLLVHLSRPPTGDRRAAYFAARPGRLGELREQLEAQVPAGSHLLEISEAIDAGLFGPPPFHPELRERLGDLLLLLPSPGGVGYSIPGARPRPLRMRGAHGGLEPEELLVPLISGSLADFSASPRPRYHPPRTSPARRKK